MDWEAWLKAAAAPPSNSEDEKRVKTEREIKAALAVCERLKPRPYIVYAKGSYANNTNVRLNYDVDIAVEYRGYFYTEYMFDLEGYTDADVGLVSSSDPYTRSHFKADIRVALVSAYGASAIKDGKIAYRIREKKTTLPADVVPSWEYRRYDRLVGGRPAYHEGARVFPSDGGHKDNFPKIQLEKGITKNTRTALRYKRMVRALKKLQIRLVESGELAEELPSYLTECLVYNVPDSEFASLTFKGDMRNVLAYIFNGTLPGGDSADWEEVNGLRYLMRGGNSWTTEDVRRMADVAWNHIGFS